MHDDVENFFNAALSNIKNSREVFLYRCFDPRFRQSYEKEYGFIFRLCDDIIVSENPSEKSKYLSRDLNFLKKLVSDLFDKNLNEIKEQIDESIDGENLSKQTVRYIKNLKKRMPTNSVLPSLSSRATSYYVKENVSFMQQINNKVNELVEEYNKSFAQKNSDDFQSLLKQRTDKEEKIITKTNKKINNPSILQRIKDWWRSPNRLLFGAGKKNEKYYGDLKVKREEKVKTSRLKIEELSSLKGKSCLELGKQAQANKVVFGNTKIGVKLFKLWDKFKSTYKKVTNSLSKTSRKKINTKKRSKSATRIPKNVVESQPPRKNSLPSRKKNSKYKKTGFFQPKKTDQKPIEILFDSPQQFHTTIIHKDYKKDKVYYVRTHISNTDYEMLKNGDKMLQNLWRGYVKYGNKMPGREFDKEKFYNIFNLNPDLHSRPRMN